MGTLPPTGSAGGMPCVSSLCQSGRKVKTMKAMTFDKSFAEKKDTFANLSRMVLTTSERLFYIKFLTRGFRSTPIWTSSLFRTSWGARAIVASTASVRPSPPPTRSPPIHLHHRLAPVTRVLHRQGAHTPRSGGLA